MGTPLPLAAPSCHTKNPANPSHGGPVLCGVIAVCAPGFGDVLQQLQGSAGPITTATDYVCAVPESVCAFLPGNRSYLTLGTDGFGRSDTRAALRDYFGVDAKSIVKAAMQVFGH